MSARNAKKAAAHQIENSLDKAEEMLTKAGYSFAKKGNVLNVSDIPVTIYYDNIGGKFTVLSTKAGTELHENKFIGGVKNFLNELRGDKAPDPTTEKIPADKKAATKDKSKAKTVKTSSPKAGVSKTTIALEIFKKMNGKKGTTRAAIIEEFISKAGLTKAGASTYYQNFIRKGVK